MQMSLMLSLHIATGAIATLSGIAALIVRKGNRWHRQAGNLFFVSMVLMCISGTYIAYTTPMMISVIAGAFTWYLVVTSWATIHTPAHRLSRFDPLFPLIAFAISISGIAFALKAMSNDNGMVDGFPPLPYLFFALLALMCTALDLRLLIYKGLTHAHRLARHLWRMCFALYIAIGSFVSQGLASLPDEIRNSVFLSLPELAIMLVMLYWLVRVLYSAKYKRRKRHRA